MSVSIVVWCIAIAVCGGALSYPMLLISRLGLGVVVAAAGPAVASLAGDLFPSSARGRIYGYILSGEIIGVAVGLLLCGNIAAVLSWRFAFWVLVPPGLFLACAIRRFLPEPARGGGDDHRPDTQGNSVAKKTRRPSLAPVTSDDDDPGGRSAPRPAVRGSVTPHAHLVLREDPASWNLWRAARFMLAVRTNRALIIGSALGYFYFTGLQTFAVIYLHGRYHLGQAASTSLLVLIGLGALVGLLLSGRIADALAGRHYSAARPVVGGTALLLCAMLLVAGLLVGSFPFAVALLFLAAAALGGANPPLDAARLDIMHPRLWRRAESVRTLLRSAFVATAPVVFGVVSSALNSAGDANGTSGIRNTLRIMTATLLAGALIILLVARRTYPGDVATARASAIDGDG